MRESSSRAPVKVLSGVKDIAPGDFYAAAVRTDGRLQVWGRQEGWEEPVTIRTGVEKVYMAREVLLFLDTGHNLFYFQSSWSEKMEGFWDKRANADRCACHLRGAAKHAIHVFYRANILNGTDRCGRFRGASDLTRGQAAAILARIIDPNQRLSFSQKDFEELVLP